MKLKKNIAVSDSGFLFNPTVGTSYSVNPVGQRIIELIKSGKSESEVVKQMLKEYVIDQATIEKDLYDFSTLLKNYKLTDTTNE